MAYPYSRGLNTKARGYICGGHMNSRSLIAGFVVIGLLSLPVYAQVGQGNIRGKVVDREGKPLQGAVVRVEQLSTHQISEGKTNRNGDYSIGVFPGQYKATLIVDGRGVMVRGDTAGSAIFVSDGNDTTANFDLRNAPATPSMAAAAPKAATDEKAKEAEKRATEEMKGAFAAGVAALGAKNFEEAVKQFKLAAEKDPTQPAIFGNMGVALSNLRRYDDA